MEKRMLGKTGMEVSALGFGGAEIGFEKVATGDVERLLGAALDAGLNVIDTAECYGGTDGHPSSEELIGRATAHRRGDFFLFTKCGHASGLDGEDWSPDLLARSIERSLQRLQTDCVDLIQLHSCGLDTLKQGDVISVLQKAKADGKTRFIGYSGDQEAALYAVECGAFDTLQTSVNIADQQCVDLYLPLAKEKNIGVIAKRPIANTAWTSGGTPPTNEYRKPYWERLGKLAYPFLSGDVSEAVSVALRWTLGVPGVHTAIVGTGKPDRWKGNAALLDAGPLPQDEWEAIRDRWREAREADWTGQG